METTPLDFDQVRALAKSSLSAYASLMHPSWEPNWHHRVIANIMERVAAAAAGNDDFAAYRRVCIQMPPRAGKTELISKLFPGWYMAQNPYHNIINASYGAELADMMGRKAREYASGDTFKSLFDIGVSRATNAITKWELENHSGFFATSVGAALTGYGANCFVAGTKITTNHGSIAIEHMQDLPESCKILAYDEDGWEWCDVEAFKVRTGFGIYRLTTASGRVVEATGDHPVWVTGKGWVKTSELTSGDILLCAVPGISQEAVLFDGFQEGHDTVARVEKICDEATVYNLQVAKKHTYFANGIKVKNCLIIDDPIKNFNDAMSQNTKDAIWDWFMSTAYTRLEKNAAAVVVMTRWATDDLVGRLLAQNDKKGKSQPWLNISFPMLAEKDEKYRAEGAPLWQEKYDLDECAAIKSQVGKRVWSALYQQRPAPEEGAIFLTEYLRYYEVDDLDDIYFSGIFQSWDTGISGKSTSARSACTTWGVSVDPSVPGGTKFYLLNVYADQLAFPELKRKVEELARTYGADTVWVEEKATGRPIMDELRLAMPGMLKGVTPIGSKEDRAKAISAVFEAGRVYLPRGMPWVEPYVDELTTFPFGQYADKVDSTTQALRMMLRAQYQASRGRQQTKEQWGMSWGRPEVVSIFGR